jgi:hypothetical protein
VPDGNPYPGLAPFADEHRAVFYGRGTDISTVVDRLRSAPLVVVAGDSGIGKSSLCRAGVLSRLEARVVQLVPGRRPLSALCAALAPICDVDEATLAICRQRSRARRGVGRRAVGLPRSVPGAGRAQRSRRGSRGGPIIASLARGVAG